MSEKKEEKKEEWKMEYRMLGGTGLKVSCLGFGCMSLNNLDQTVKLMKAARPNAKQGVNFFDNAELYGQPLGQAEALFGEALQKLQKEDPKLWRRTDLVITTKLFFGVGDGNIDNTPLATTGAIQGVNETGLSLKHLKEGMDSALKRLKLEYVDIVYAHRACDLTPMLEVVRGFTNIIKKGQAFYWGTSMWTPVQIAKAYYLAKLHNLIPPVVEQPIYNMNTREYLENHYVELFDSPFKLGTTVWSPLDAGYLTGKYNDKDKIPKDSRIGGKENRLSSWWSQLDQKKIETCKKLVPIAEELKVSMVELALGWVLKNKNVSVCILGGRKPHQITQNLKCISAAAKMDDKVMKKIEEALGNKPKSDFYNVGNVKMKKIIN